MASTTLHSYRMPRSSLSIAASVGERSIRPSRRRSNDSVNLSDTLGSTMITFSTVSDRETAIETMLDALQKTRLPGPVMLIGVPEFLGQGYQFSVNYHRMVRTSQIGFSVIDVAVKIPKFPNDPSRVLDLASTSVRQHLHDMYLEILALTNPLLSDHPNIARLLAWGVEVGGFDRIPTLVMELAHSNLATMLSERHNELADSDRYSLCLDIGAGLDVIHDCKIVHGDLKPENVLIYMKHGNRVAKLADFGLSIAESKLMECGTRLGGTPGWQAPEVVSGNFLQSDGLFQADNYSFGLLLWSTMLCYGRPPQTSQSKEVGSLAIDALQTARLNLGVETSCRLSTALQNLLANEPGKRPLRIADVLGEGRPGGTRFPNTYDSDSGSYDDEATPLAYPDFKCFEWEVTPVPDVLMDGLYNRILKMSTDVPADICFAIFLTFYEDGELRLGLRNTDREDSFRSRAITSLLAAASQGHEAAQSVVPAVYRHFRLQIPHEVRSSIRTWLQMAVSTGSIIARHELQKIDHDDVESIVDVFRKRGGYNKQYDHIKNTTYHQHGMFHPDTQSPDYAHTYTLLHRLAAYGSLEELRTHLEEVDRADVNSTTADLETPLFLAFVRGSSLIATELLNHGACPASKCTVFQSTCMHWTFALRADSLTNIIAELCRRGADINALASRPMPFMHYPFVLPAGTSLHWAVVTSCKPAIRALIENGADVQVRDGSDPYLHDERVRVLNKFGGINNDPFSIPRSRTQGLSALDYAAIQHEPYIFEILLAQNRPVEINSVDEEGFSALHRVSSSRLRRTRMGVEFSMAPFQGGPAERFASLKATVEAIKALGGDLEQLTKGSGTAQSDRGVLSLTPIMLAMDLGASEVVRALLEVGASVHTRNHKGETALHHLPDTSTVACLDCVSLLCFYDAEVDAQDKNGTTPMLKAATILQYTTVNLLLSKGADTAQRDSRSEGASIFCLLARGSSQPIEYDIAVAHILQTYLFTCPDARRKQELMNKADTNRTLLYCFADNSMFHCVEALIREGVDVNATSTSFITTGQGKERRYDVPVYRTPLDAVQRRTNRRKDQMARDRLWSADEFEALLKRDRETIEIIRKAGGIMTPEDLS